MKQKRFFKLLLLSVIIVFSGFNLTLKLGKTGDFFNDLKSLEITSLVNKVFATLPHEPTMNCLSCGGGEMTGCPLGTTCCYCDGYIVCGGLCYNLCYCHSGGSLLEIRMPC
jgi:hypothetical protein